MPLAVNTILLGLAVYPTWLVVRDHVPDTTDKFAVDGSKVDGSERTSDEESFEVQEVSLADREKLAVGQTTAPGASHM